MNPAQIESTIAGLKYNVKSGFNQAREWKATYDKSLKNLLKSWRMIDDEDEVAKMAWETVQDHYHWMMIDSEDIDVYSTIGELVVPAKTYSTKKGVEKTKPEERVPAHFTEKGQYLGRVSEMGAEPIVYPLVITITPRHFDFNGVGKTLEDCFILKEKDDYLLEGKFATADIHRSQMKEFRAKKREMKKEERKNPEAGAIAVSIPAPIMKRKKPVVAPVVEELDEEDEDE
jgi:hypothetical protein